MTAAEARNISDQNKDYKVNQQLKVIMEEVDKASIVGDYDVTIKDTILDGTKESLIKGGYSINYIPLANGSPYKIKISWQK